MDIIVKYGEMAFYALFGLGILVLIHELGHLVVARWSGIGVEAFSIFFGRALFKFKWKNIEWRIGWIPFGGYCKMKGQEDFGKGEIKGEADEFYQRPSWARLLTVLAGPVCNIILGILIFAGIFFFFGESIVYNGKIAVKPGYKDKLELKNGDIIQYINQKPVTQIVNGKEIQTFNMVLKLLKSGIGKKNSMIVKRNGKIINVNYQFNDTMVEKLKKDGFGFSHYFDTVSILEITKNSPSEKAGMRKGDIILSINDKPIHSPGFISSILNKHGKNIPEKFKFLLQRDGKKLLVYVKPKVYPKSGTRLIIGIIPKGNPSLKSIHMNYSLLASIPRGAEESWDFITLQYKALSQLKFKTIVKSASGPIGIVSALGKTGSENLFQYISFLAALSILLGVFNLLPIPAVDGGHVVLTLFEIVRRKPLSIEVIQRIQVVGVFIIISLVILITINDVYNIFGQ